MTRADRVKLLLLGVLGGLVAAFIARFQPAPGYMDADYYQAVGERFISGAGLTEPFLWNYLDDPHGLPHPANAYWMPLPSLLAAAGMWLSGQKAFWAGRLGFIALAGLLPPLTAITALWLHKQRKLAWVSGGLAIFSAFYAVFLPTTDGFGLYMLWGTLFLWVSADKSRRQTLALGLLVALMHLTRADGVLWLLPALWLAWRRAPRQRRLCGVLVGYAGVMLPWFVRNWIVFGSPLAPGGGRSLFLRAYNDLFLYPASALTWQYWVQDGLAAIARVRLWAAGLNLGTFLAVQGGIFWLPFILLAAWQLRRDVRVQTAALGWGLTFLAFTLAFPFAGARGGFFHSGAALQPFFWVLAPYGLQEMVAWLEARRQWQTARALPRLLTLFLAMTIALTAFLVGSRVVMADWGSNARRYAQIEDWIRHRQQDDIAPVIVANPPGYWLATERSALALPGGGPEMVLQVADDFGARYLVLEPGSYPDALTALFLAPRTDGRFLYLTTIEGAHIYAIAAP